MLQVVFRGRSPQMGQRRVGTRGRSMSPRARRGMLLLQLFSCSRAGRRLLQKASRFVLRRQDASGACQVRQDQPAPERARPAVRMRIHKVSVSDGVRHRGKKYHGVPHSDWGAGGLFCCGFFQMSACAFQSSAVRFSAGWAVMRPTCRSPSREGLKDRRSEPR